MVHPVIGPRLRAETAGASNPGSIIVMAPALACPTPPKSRAKAAKDKTCRFPIEVPPAVEETGSAVDLPRQGDFRLVSGFSRCLRPPREIAQQTEKGRKLCP